MERPNRVSNISQEHKKFEISPLDQKEIINNRLRQSRQLIVQTQTNAVLF